MKNPESSSKHLALGASVLLALAVVWFVHGAVPFIAMPTLGQAVWTTGFAQSFANQAPWALYAVNFGQPEPAPIAFGLAGALPTSWLITLGLSAADAYATMVATWLAIALAGAMWLALQLGARPLLALLAAVVWLTLPLVWWHAQYSMLALGMALLPSYHAVCLHFSRVCAEGSDRPLGPGLLYLVAAVVAVFMDGYTFMMFACGASLLVAAEAWRMRRCGQIRCLILLGGHGLVFAVAYLLFSLYVGRTTFEAAPLEFFRGWGLDLTYLFRPSDGIHWLWDTLGLSVNRTRAHHFGDASVWRPTFLLPLLLFGLWGLWRQLRCTGRRKGKRPLVATTWLAIALLGGYLALGPSLKVNSLRPESVDQHTSHMAAEYAVLPTGSAWLSQHVPGFNNMRAAYRWAGLGALGLWALAVMGLVYSSRLGYWRHVLLMLLVVTQWPNPSYWERAKGYRDSFHNIDATLLNEFAGDLQLGERVAFLPWRNDFLVNYLAASLELRAFNIGGDKNLSMARQHWPAILKEFPMYGVDDAFVERVHTLLAQGSADVVVIPYLDMLWAAHSWPASRSLQHHENVVAELAAYPGLVVKERDDYAVVRLGDG